MILKTFTLTLTSTRPIRGSAIHLRGFFATKFNEYTLLHQHNADKLIYKYPLVQYKMINKTPTVIGINEGIEVLKEIYDKYDEINLNGNIYEIVERGIAVKEQEFGISDQLLSYRFVTPWLALNQDNFMTYNRSDRAMQNERLRKTLTGNILSASKGLGYVVPDTIRLEIGRTNKVMCKVKGVQFVGFFGEFIVNFEIPDYLGLGKSVSRGYGAVEKIKNQNNQNVVQTQSNNDVQQVK
ncbi:MAG: CRISPR-associated endonuclease Cas6 [Methanosarcinaceae archaeon]